MANLYDTSATKALNEDAYINKIYDGTLESQKKALQQGYDNSVKQLATGQQSTQKQTADYVKRAYVEGQRSAGHLQKPTPSISTPGMGNGGANAQTRLTMGNQQQKNVSALNNQQAVADQEFERRRKLLADQYAAQIKQAQADNDMIRAQALYDAAKAEEEQLRSFRQNAAVLMQSKGDNSIIDAIARGDAVQRDTDSPTWDGVLKNEDSINKIYDAQIESARQEAQMAYAQALSDLEAQQQAAVRETDQNLNDAYVNALKKNQNYQEVQNAYGQGSGASIRARLARETGLTEKLTDLRRLQLGKDANAEVEKAGLADTLGGKIASAQKTADEKRNADLYKAAENEEQALIEEQKTIGNLLAKQNDYSVLGKLYGLTQDQIDRLQGTGRYAPVSYGVGGSGGGGYDGEKPGYYQGWSNKALQNMANQGIANYEANRTPLSSSAKQELAKPTVVRGSSSSQKYVK